MTPLATILQPFFTDYVHTHRSLSANTIAAYRDTWKLLLTHLGSTTGTRIDQLCLEDLTSDSVTTFLAYLRDDRKNSPATRNHRLTAIRSVLAYALPGHPEHAEDIRQILAISPARTSRPTLSYLTIDEQAALLAAPDTTRWIGRRDRMTLVLTLNTGLRISELINLAIDDAHTQASGYVECEGKGRKHRATPLNSDVCALLRTYLDERATLPGNALFPGPRGAALTRDALEARLAVHLKTAAASCCSLSSKRISWHGLRHTTAVNMLRAGVDITVIALWLGHEHTSTTDIYLHYDMETKKAAMELTRPAHVAGGTFSPAPDLLAWLDNL